MKKDISWRELNKFTKLILNGWVWIYDWIWSKSTFNNNWEIKFNAPPLKRQLWIISHQAFHNSSFCGIFNKKSLTYNLGIIFPAYWTNSYKSLTLRPLSNSSNKNISRCRNSSLTLMSGSYMSRMMTTFLCTRYARIYIYIRLYT